MLIKDMFDRVLVNSGQFILPPEKIELKIDPFLTLVRQVLGEYNQYSPVDYTYNIDISSSRQYTFTAESERGIPQFISDLLPVRIMGVNPFYLSGMQDNRLSSSYLEQKQELPFNYSKPVLTVSMSGIYAVTSVHHHAVVGDSPETYEVKTINDQSDEFLNMLTGKFMVALGRSRSAFTLQSLEILTDAVDLISDGKELYTNAKQDLEENKSRFYLAWV